MNQDRPCPINVGSSNCFWKIWKILLSYCYVLKRKCSNFNIEKLEEKKNKTKGPSGEMREPNLNARS
jgi:hypothetical protein